MLTYIQNHYLDPLFSNKTTW